jgi:NADH dehydrogenase
MAGRPLTPFGPELSAKGAHALAKLGVEQHMHSIVTGIDATGLSIRAEDGRVTRHEAGTMLWTAGGGSAAGGSGDRSEQRRQAGPRGCITAGDDCAIPDNPEIFVTGEAMGLNKLAGVAEVAM